MTEVCEVVGANVTMVAGAIGHDARIGHKYLGAGLGFRGGCLPKHMRAFMARAEELGVDQALNFLREVDAINVRCQVRTVDLAREMCGGSLAGARVGVLGAAFKPDSDDIRDSPALDVALAVQRAGAAVRVYDPHAMDNARVSFPPWRMPPPPPPPATTPTSCSTSPSGRSSARWSRPCSPRWSAAATSSMHATRSPASAGRPTAGSTAPSAAAPSEAPTRPHRPCVRIDGTPVSRRCGRCLLTSRCVRTNGIPVSR